MKTIKHLFTALLLLCTTAVAAHDFEVNGICYNINSASNNLEVTYKGRTYDDYYNEYVGRVVIPESFTYKGVTYRVVSIGKRAFRDCTGLTSIVIPNSVKSIGDEAFDDCTGLTSVEIPNSVTSIGDWAFWCCSGLTSVEIGNSVTSIGNYAFSGCSDLETLYISNTIESIGDNAFAECNNLLEIKIGSKKAITASKNVFSSDAYNNACLYVPTGRKDSYAKTSPWSNFIIKEMDFTGIDEVAEQRAEGKNVYYDLSGRVVENPTSGVYIINGKKVLVK